MEEAPTPVAERHKRDTLESIDSGRGSIGECQTACEVHTFPSSCLETLVKLQYVQKNIT